MRPYGSPSHARRYVRAFVGGESTPASASSSSSFRYVIDCADFRLEHRRHLIVSAYTRNRVPCTYGPSLRFVARSHALIEGVWPHSANEPAPSATEC